MRVAALFDIHGNLPALEAVLDELDRIGVDRIVVGGDVVPGPMPREVLDRLLGRHEAVQYVRGNGEAAVIDAREGRPLPNLPASAKECVEWTASELSDTQIAELKRWPLTDAIPIGGLSDVLFCHAKPTNEFEIFIRSTDEDSLLGAFAEVKEPVVVCGHTHMQFDRVIGRTRVMNAGSVGMPFANPGAYWLLLSPKGINFRCTRYDFDRAANRIRSTRYPAAISYAEKNVLDPPSAPDMEALFHKAP